jgi:uncharacterized membrane protein
MDTALFSGQGMEFMFRFGHFLAGVCWIGVLWYFNFIQGSYFAEADAGAKSDAMQKLVPRALWWFRWGAMGTFLTGVALLGIKSSMAGAAILNTSWGVTILTGALMGTFMWFNVWFIIWPAQKIAIASATAVAGGGSADPAAAGAGAKAGLASRTNTLFSLPLLFFMGAASHLPVSVGPEGVWCAFFAAAAVIVVIELNGLFGKLGPMKSVTGVIHCGLALTAVLFGLVECLT